jgi:integrase
MPGPRKQTIENTPGVWLKADGRYGWDFRIRREDGTEFRRGGSRSTLKDASDSYEAAKAEFESGPKTAPTKTLEEWVTYCLETLFPTEGLSPREIDNRRSSYKKHWLPTFGTFQLEQISKTHIRSKLKEMEEAGASFDGRRNARNHMKALYAAASREFPGFTHNPADIPIGKRPTRNAEGQRITHKRVLAADEQAELLKAAKNDPYWIGVFLGLKLGLRRAEILGLRWVHIDFKENLIHITDTTQRAAGKGRYTKDTKTEAGDRRIPIPLCVRRELEKRKAQSAKCPYVLTSALGCPAEPRKFSEAMKTFVTVAKLIGNTSRYGDPLPDPTLHDLRHTFASEMANVHKIGPKTLMQLMGHDDIKTTLAYYVEASEEAMAEAMALVA